MSGAERAGHDRIVATTTESLGAERVAELLAAGRALEVGDAVRHARG